MKDAMKVFLAVVIVGLVALRPGTSLAGNWSAAALGCNIDPNEVSTYHPYFYDTQLGQGGFVTYDVSTTGAIDLFCPVQYPNGLSGPTTLSLGYIDNTASGSNRIVVTYYKMDKNTASLTAIATLNTATTSGCGPTSTYKKCSVSFTDTMNLGGYIYFVTIGMYRTTASVTQDSYQVSLSP